MIYLLLNIVFGSLFVLCIKWIQVRKQEDIVTIGMINYIAGALAILPEFMQSRPAVVTAEAMVTGGAMGACYFVAFFFVVYAIKWVGVASSTVIGVLSILCPILVGIFVWHENPNRLQMLGVGLALMSLTLIGSSTDSKKPAVRKWFVPLILVGFFVLAGASRLAQEAFRHVCHADERPVFLFTGFCLAAIPSVLVLVLRQKRVAWRECLIGVLLGTANILQTHFILKALKEFEGYIVFPVVSAGGLIFTTLVATWFLGERLTGRTYIGIVFATVALLLLNWK
ncbi:MAG: EamA family transporter [Mariniblastus sp.]|nr:EamA family transporter [Mariniblastus sp.]